MTLRLEPTISPARPETTPWLAPPNLLLTFEEIAALLGDALRRRDRLNAFLLTAALSQIADDHAERDPARLGEVAEFLRTSGREVPGRGLAALAGGARALHDLRPATRGHELRALVAETASSLVEGRDPDVALEPPVPPELARELVRLPACFHAFDQRPEDVERLADAVARLLPDRTRALLVVGVRTSGSYLAPLLAASLRARGYTDVGVLTARPGRAPAAETRRAVRACASRGGAGIVVDDVPGTGRSFLAAARALERGGVRRDAIVLAVPLFAGQELPAALGRYASTVLPGEAWEIERRLEPAAVRAELEGLLGPLDEVEPLPLPGADGARGHRRALFRVRVAGSVERLVLAEGVGLGWFGAHALAVAEQLSAYTPRVHGLVDGLLYREWLPEERRADAEGLPAAVAGYVVARSEALPVDRDRSLGLAGQDPAWEVVSAILARAFLRAWPVARVAFLDRATKLLLCPARPAVVDGKTGRSEWFAREPRASAVAKVGFASRGFWHLGLTCFDPVFDLAGVDPGGADEGSAWELRRTYEERTGEGVDPERWLLYQLAHVWGRGRTHPHEEPALRRASARALQRYFAETLLADVAAPPAGPLCAIDLDGVLETESLGVPSTTGAGALALRALALHGFRPVLVSGRSAPEVAERCAHYRLAGGVAEYGAVVHDARSGGARVLLPPDARAALESARAALAELDGVTIDGDYRHCVRAYRSAGGGRYGLPEAAIAAALRDGGTCAVRGEGQTDFVAAGIDKATGLRVLLGELGDRLALAVGDTVSDLPMLALAERAFAPASADAHVRAAGVPLVRRPYQAGLAEAVGRLLGHRPGGCPVCRAPEVSRRTRLLLDLLSAREAGPVDVPRRLAKLAWRVRTW